MFTNRAEAGHMLAKKLEHYRGSDAVVCAIPRGGVVVGHEIARALELPLDIIAVRKIGHPDSPEYAVCAVDSKGVRICNEAEVQNISEEWLADATKEQQAEAQRRERVYRDGAKGIDVSGRAVILVDDGVATGLTLRLALLALKRLHPRTIIVALPVAPVEVAEGLRADADEVEVLEIPELFLGAVGNYYEQFEQVEDEEVLRLLRACRPAVSTA